MKNKKTVKIIAYGLTAVLLFILLTAATFRDRFDRMERRQVRVVVFGDSVFGLIRDETGISAQLERLMGEPVFNAALGGTCISRADREYRLDDTGDAMSLVALTKAASVEDFGVQQTVRTRDFNKEYFDYVVDELEQIDFSGVELVLIQHGLNDFYKGIPLENPEDPFDEYTLKGALRSSIRSLRQANPDMRILLLTPTYTWHRQSGLTCEEFNAGYGNQETYVQAEIEVAEEMGVELIDLYHDLFPHEKWEDWEIYTWDGLHPNETAREMLAEMIADYLENT